MMVIKCECLPRTTWAVISRCLILTEIQRGRCWRTCAVQRRPGRIQLWGSWLRRPGLCLLSISRCANPCPTLGMFFRGFNVVSCTVVWLVISIGHWSRSKWFLYFRPGYLCQGGGYAIGAVCLWATILLGVMIEATSQKNWSSLVVIHSWILIADHFSTSLTIVE